MKQKPKPFYKRKKLNKKKFKFEIVKFRSNPLYGFIYNQFIF